MELNEEKLEEIVGGANQAQGMACPKCGKFISIEMKDLLNAVTFTCPNCGIRFDVNWQTSKKAMDAMSKVGQASGK